MREPGLIIFEIMLVLGSFILGLVIGVTGHYSVDPIVIQAVKKSDGRYKYDTNTFNFISDSLYSIGDTLELKKK